MSLEKFNKGLIYLLNNSIRHLQIIKNKINYPVEIINYLPNNQGLKPLMSKDKKAVVCGAFRQDGMARFPRHIQSTKGRKKISFLTNPIRF